jgi:hypothetical protein
MSAGQAHGNFGAPSWRTLDQRDSAALLSKVANLSETETGALTRSLGREERIESSAANRRLA